MVSFEPTIETLSYLLTIELTQLQNDVNQIEAQVSQLTQYQSSSSDQVNEFQAEIDRKTQLLTTLEGENATMRNQLNEVDQESMKLVRKRIYYSVVHFLLLK